jgi:hypothetical protein
MRSVASPGFDTESSLLSHRRKQLCGLHNRVDSATASPNRESPAHGQKNGIIDACFQLPHSRNRCFREDRLFGGLGEGTVLARRVAGCSYRHVAPRGSCLIALTAPRRRGLTSNASRASFTLGHGNDLKSVSKIGWQVLEAVNRDINPSVNQ